MYNANAGIVNALLDGLHKALRPETYPCDLCAVTYGIATVKTDWKLFIQSLEIEPRFLYKDQLQGALAVYQPPFVAQWDGSMYRIILSRMEIDARMSVSEFIEKLWHALRQQ